MTHTKSKAIRTAYERWKKSNTPYLWDCYSTYSENKRHAFNYCDELKGRYRGDSGRIISYNAQVFSYGFVGSIGGKRAFFYITRDNDRYIFLDELEV